MSDNELQFGNTPRERVLFLNRQAELMSQAQLIGQAKDALASAHKLLCEEPDIDDRKGLLATTFHNLGLVHHRNGEYTPPKAGCKRALYAYSVAAGTAAWGVGVFRGGRLIFGGFSAGGAGAEQKMVDFTISRKRGMPSILYVHRRCRCTSSADPGTTRRSRGTCPPSPWRLCPASRRSFCDSRQRFAWCRSAAPCRRRP